MLSLSKFVWYVRKMGITKKLIVYYLRKRHFKICPRKYVRIQLWLQPARASSNTQDIYIYLLYRHECFTGKYTTRKIHKNYIRDPSGLFSIISLVSSSMT